MLAAAPHSKDSAQKEPDSVLNLTSTPSLHIISVSVIGLQYSSLSGPHPRTLMVGTGQSATLKLIMSKHLQRLWDVAKFGILTPRCDGVVWASGVELNDNT